MANLLKLLTWIVVIVVIVYSRAYLKLRGLDKGEFYLLVLFATLGMMVMISANHLLTLYLGLELLSLSLYALVALDRDSARATEAAMKYFVLGALASGLLLYGMSMIYGATGTLEIGGIAQSMYQGTANKSVLLFGLVFLVAGIGVQARRGAFPHVDSRCLSRRTDRQSHCSSALRRNSPPLRWRCACWSPACSSSPSSGRPCC